MADNFLFEKILTSSNGRRLDLTGDSNRFLQNLPIVNKEPNQKFDVRLCSPGLSVGGTLSKRNYAWAINPTGWQEIIDANNYRVGR